MCQDADPTAKDLPGYVRDEFYAYLQCGILAHGFLKLGCDSCPQKMLLAFSCKRRGFCPSCAGRRMAQTAAHLVEQVIPWVATRQWVVSVPIPLRYWMAAAMPTRHLITPARQNRSPSSPLQQQAYFMLDTVSFSDIVNICSVYAVTTCCFCHLD